MKPLTAVKMDPPEGVKLGIAALEKGLDSEKISKLLMLWQVEMSLGLDGWRVNKFKNREEKSALIRQSWIAKGLVSPKLINPDELSGIPYPRLNTPNQMLRNSSNLVKG